MYHGLGDSERGLGRERIKEVSVRVLLVLFPRGACSRAVTSISRGPTDRDSERELGVAEVADHAIRSDIGRIWNQLKISRAVLGRRWTAIRRRRCGVVSKPRLRNNRITRPTRRWTVELSELRRTRRHVSL